MRNRRESQTIPCPAPLQLKYQIQETLCALQKIRTLGVGLQRASTCTTANKSLGQRIAASKLVKTTTKTLPPSKAEDTLEAILKTLVNEREWKDGELAPKREFEKNEDDIALISELALTTTIPNNKHWILDTRATEHVTGNFCLLNKLRHDIDSIFVRTASGHSYPLQGRGSEVDLDKENTNPGADLENFSWNGAS